MITYQHILRSFNGNLPLTLKTLKDWCSVEDIEYLPRPGTLLHHGGSRVKVRTDMVIAPEALMNGYWQPEEIQFAKFVTRVDKYSLVDVGANMGLFSRQMVSNVPGCISIHCYEPNELNFELLKFNLQDWKEISHFHHFGLSDKSGVSAFYENVDNSGKYSLNKGSMFSEDQFITSQITLKDVKEESSGWMSDVPVFYKSDTEGHDETIICSIPPDFWKGVYGGLIEVFRIDKPDWDKDIFESFLRNFSNLVFLDNPRNLMSHEEVMKIILGKKDGFNKDLGFWK
jgi:FkbM family methyltransferase